MQRIRWAALALGALSLLLWLASYSWLVGVAPPTQWLSPTASPWLVAEVAAAVTGAAAVPTGLLLSGRSPGTDRRVPLCAAAMGAFALVMSALSLTMPT